MLQLSRASLGLEVVRGYNATYVIHQLVADLFGDREDRGYLYRVLARAPREAEVLVLSGDAPRPDAPERAWGRIACVESKDYGFTPEASQVLDYEIRINATRVVTDTSGRKTRVDIWDHVFREDRTTGLTPHDVYRAYLERRLGDAAQVLACRVVERGEERASRAGKKPIRWVSANLIGSLKVREPTGFLNVMASGLGRSKAFGHGLLCLSKPGTVLPRRYGGAGLL